MRGSFRIGKIAGIEIGVHYTWIFALILFAWIFAQNTQVEYPGWDVRNYWILGTVVSLMLFFSVLIHELCHSLVAMRRGMKVSSIVFFIFGGVSNIENEPESARAEFLMAVAGPFSSLIIGGIFLGISFLLGSPLVSSASPLIVTMYYIGYVNLVLAIFNIVPGFPLDGGRVLRSIIWGISKNLHRATIIAGNVGRLFGWAMILMGVALIFGIDVWVFQKGLFNGIWLILIGWFLTSAADNAMREQSYQLQLAGIKVKDVMDRTPECTSPASSVESVVHDSFILRGRRSLPVCDDKGLIGIVTLTDVKKLPQDQWANTPVQQIMTRMPLLTVDQEEDLNKALQVLAKNGLNQIPVLNASQFVGLLSRADVIRYLQTRQELGIKSAH
jgi:Zn-dependent protease